MVVINDYVSSLDEFWTTAFHPDDLLFIFDVFCEFIRVIGIAGVTATTEPIGVGIAVACLSKNPAYCSYGLDSAMDMLPIRLQVWTRTSVGRQQILLPDESYMLGV